MARALLEWVEFSTSLGAFPFSLFVSPIVKGLNPWWNVRHEEWLSSPVETYFTCSTQTYHCMRQTLIICTGTFISTSGPTHIDLIDWRIKICRIRRKEQGPQPVGYVCMSAMSINHCWGGWCPLTLEINRGAAFFFPFFFFLVWPSYSLLYLAHCSPLLGRLITRTSPLRVW